MRLHLPGLFNLQTMPFVACAGAAEAVPVMVYARHVNSVFGVCVGTMAELQEQEALLWALATWSIDMSAQ